MAPRDFLEEAEKRGERRRAAGEKAPRPRVVSDASWGRATEEALEMAAEEKWDNARPLHLVALNAKLFERVYGFEMLDMTPALRMAACGMAAALLKGVFGGEAGALAAYMKWVWKREGEREEWRKKNGKGGQTIGWRLVFGRGLLNEFANDHRRKSSKR